MPRRNIFQTPKLLELKMRRRRAFLKKACILFLAKAAVVALLVYISRLPGINIETIVTEGNVIVDAEAIRSTVSEQISGKYIWLFPKTNVLIYPKKGIEKALRAKYTRLDTISLSVKNNRILMVSLSEREPSYTWCGEIPEKDVQEKCYFLDTTGYIFDEAPYFSGDVYFKFYGGSGMDTSQPLGSYFAQGYFGELILFKDALPDLGLKPVTFSVKEDGDAEITLESANTVKPKILIRTTADTGKLLENLDAAVATEPLKTRLENEYAKLEYLDLRFDNKVYSKFRK